MARHVEEDKSIEPVADICSSIAGALESDPVTTDLSSTWDALTAKADTLSTTKRTLTRTLGRARAKLEVADASWDPEIAAFGRDVVNETDGKRDQPPYTRFFKNVTPSEAQKFGIDREVEQGETWVGELAREPNEPLAVKWSPRLTAATGQLKGCSTGRKDALKALALHNIAEELFIDDLNREIDLLEGELIKRFPRQPKRVASFLEALRPRNTSKRNDNDDNGNDNGNGNTDKP
jgi:hypothetical protein